MEKEWLLLGEASSPINQPNQDAMNAESSILSDTTMSDTECIVKADNSDSESEEDIDSIVEEFQQKVKVTTAGLKDSNLKIPSMSSWRLAMIGVFSIVGSSTAAAISALYELAIPFALSVMGESNNSIERNVEFNVTELCSRLCGELGDVVAAQICLLS